MLENTVVKKVPPFDELVRQSSESQDSQNEAGDQPYFIERRLSPQLHRQRVPFAFVAS
jgi:hypothetical protein